jgi:penicillin amidase
MLARTPANLRSQLFSLSDPYNDAPTADGAPAPLATLPPLANNTPARMEASAFDDTPPIGSNEWAVGASHSSTHRALLANDPHLRLQIPEIWYLLDMQAPGFHVAGGSLAGTPGVILGHNDAIAWGATNGTVVTEVLYRHANTVGRRTEVFHVRFGRDATKTYDRDVHGFVSGAYAVDWNADTNPQSATEAFDGLNRARNVAEAMRVLHRYAGPPQNFVIAGRNGQAAYTLAGPVPQDPLWGLAVHAENDPHYQLVPANALPHVDPSNAAVVFTANNRMYGRGYPLRLSAKFSAPYRASRIGQLLHAKNVLSPEDFAAMQSDTFSIPEYAIARAVVTAFKGRSADAKTRRGVELLRGWDGHFNSNSRGAPLAWRLRQELVGEFDRMLVGADADEYHTLADGADLSLLMRGLHERPRLQYAGGWDALLRSSLAATLARNDPAMLTADWGAYNRISIRHPLAALGMSFLNGRTLPGNGDSYSLHVQTDGHSQSFRAIWDVGNWDAGGISIPSGESGEPGSGHYTDLTDAWIANKTVALPFSDAAVRAATVSTLTLTP